MDPIVKRLKEDYLTCVICFELYNEPKVLSCLHTFCEVCLDALIQKSSEKEQPVCPICREIVPLTEQSVSGLKTHFAYKDMIEKIIRSKGLPLKKLCSFCMLHSKEVEATYKCLTCMDLLCELCAKTRHTYTRQTANHNVVHVRDYLATKHKEPISHEIPCDQHQERLRFFCQQCSIPICGECAIVEHIFHDYVSFAEARDIAKEELKKVLQISKAKQEKRQQIHTTLVSKSEEISANESFLLDKIDSTYKEIESKLKNHRQIVEEEIKRKSSHERKNVDINIQDNLNLQDNLQSSVLFFENMLCKGSDAEVVFFLRSNEIVFAEMPRTNGERSKYFPSKFDH
ncbi:E3 ubiquitin-protein ligase TRIM56-like [Ostrea edulis]|uniref:E3 ubiquitin-protein ligase TRIM56-like n=1 Tax=Ostrea edulis TaxID=37623 RepID=UPI0024AF7066|nr:E3 ubiquitin-protein ligase TRIM56-like [Ostrea edulis]